MPTIPAKFPVEDFAAWPAMSMDRYASLESMSGARIAKQGDIYWRQVRSFFHRPLIPFRKYDLESTSREFKKFGAFQHAVCEGQPHNSYLNLVVYEDVRSYEARRLHRGPARNLVAAMENGVQVRRLSNEKDFCDQGYPIYLSFYHRAKYSFASHRKRREGFAHWARALFQFPELVLLGGFSGPTLVGFGIACKVQDAVILKTSMHSDQGLTLRTPDLILHHWRQKAQEDGAVDVIYDGGLSTDGIDEFKLRRGARVVSLPAYLHANPLLLRMIKRISKPRYDLLVGHERTD